MAPLLLFRFLDPGHEVIDLTLIIEIPANQHTLFQVFQCSQKLRDILFPDMAEDSDVRAAVPLILITKPNSDFVLDKELVCEITCHIEEHKISVAEGKLLDRPVELFSQMEPPAFLLFSCVCHPNLV